MKKTNPGSIENAPISLLLKEFRKDSGCGLCDNLYILFWAKKIGLNLKKEERLTLENYGESYLKGYENYIRGDCEVGGTTFEEVLQRKRLQEIKLGQLPR